MKKLLPVLIVMILLPISISALETPDVTIYPSNISANSSFLIAVDMHTIGNESIRVTWIAPGVENGYGLFPKSGDKYICYFSNTDSESTCGPNPYTTPFTYTMQLNAINQRSETSNKTLTLSVGGIAIIPQISVIDKTAYMIVLTTGIPNSVYYTVYHTNLTEAKASRRMDYSPATDKYNANVTLIDGEYYIVFEASSTSDFGGGVKRIVIGEDVAAPGGDQSPSHEGANISVDKIKLNVLIPSPGEEREVSGFKLTNLRDSELPNLSVSVPSDLSKYLDISFDKLRLDENETTFFTVELDNIQNGMNINASIPVKSGTETIGEILADIKVSVLGGSGGVTQVSQDLRVEPDPIISGDYLRTETITKEFTLKNLGTGDITDISYEISSNIEDITEVDLPASVSGGMSEKATVRITPGYTGTYAGTVKIETSAGSVTVAVNIRAYRDIGSEIELKRTELDGIETDLSSEMQALLSGIFEIIRNNIDSAKTDFDNKDYLDAEKGFASIEGQITVMNDLSRLLTPGQIPDGGGSAPPVAGLNPTVVIIIIIIVVVLVVVILLKNKGKLNIKRSEDAQKF